MSLRALWSAKAECVSGLSSDAGTGLRAPLEISTFVSLARSSSGLYLLSSLHDVYTLFDCLSAFSVAALQIPGLIDRVGQSRIYTPYMTIW